MSNAVLARQQGDDYQARCFWLEAARLFATCHKVERVGFELNTHKAFDDVVVSYAVPVPDGRGGEITRDFLQVKFHVVNGDALTWDALHTPEDFGGTSVSILQRLHAAVTTCAADGVLARFYIVTPWAISSSDPLGKFVSNVGGEIRLDKLFDGTTDRSQMGKIRKEWRTHLGLGTNDELKTVLSPLRFRTNHGTLDQLRERMNRELAACGFRALDANAQANPYDDLIRKLHGVGRSEFTRDELRVACEGDGLWVGCEPKPRGGKPIGVRSFMRRAEHLEDVTEELLCLAPHFDYRTLRPGRDWASGVAAEVSAFLNRVTTPGGDYLLHLDAHGTIAFLCGHCLDTKSGARVSLVQKRAGGVTVWEQTATSTTSLAPSLQTEELVTGTAGPQLAVAVSLTHDVKEDVSHYVKASLPPVGRLIHCHTAAGPGQLSVRDGAHAFALAEEVARIVRGARSASSAGLPVHLFLSAPNGVQFYLGQLARMLGPVTLYEFDPEAGALGAYKPSVSLPLPQ